MSLLTPLLDFVAARWPRLVLALAEALSARAPARALALFARAARAGNTQAAYRVGEAYFTGQGTMCHAFAAARWYCCAAEAGHPQAQCRLAQLYISGLPRTATAPQINLFAPAQPGEADYEAALPWALRAAEAGLPEAQAMLGHIFTTGPTALRAPDAALEWYGKSARQGCAEGALGYGLALLQRAHDAAGTAAARAQLERAAEAGLPVAHYLLGRLSESEEGGAPVARRHYEIAGKAGLGLAQTRLGLQLYETDPLNGETWLRRAALGGDPEAAAWLGNLYANSGPQSEAACWWRLAAERGHIEAARALGTLCLTGGNAVRDPVEAVRWLTTAAEAGLPDAQAALAECHVNGRGVARDHEAACSWFLRAAAAGHAGAMFALGALHSGGFDLAENLTTARHWFAQGAAHNHPLAAIMLARYAMHGTGGGRDMAAARHWYAHAAALGVPAAAEELSALNQEESDQATEAR